MLKFSYLGISVCVKVTANYELASPEYSYADTVYLKCALK